MDWTTLSLILLIYCLTGAIFLLCYVLAMQPEKQQTILGLIMLGWPLVIAIELTLALATQFGSVGVALSAKLKRAQLGG